MKKALIAFILFLGILVLAGLLVYLLVPREKLLGYVTPEVQYVTVKNANITETKTTMDVDLAVTSKLVPVFVDSLVYDFRIAEQSLARGHRKFLPATKTGKVQQLLIPVSITREEARDLLQKQILEGRKVRAHVEAYCRIPLVGIRRVDIDRDVDLAVPIPGINILGSAHPFFKAGKFLTFK
jgi:hypothetical protein